MLDVIQQDDPYERLIEQTYVLHKSWVTFLELFGHSPEGIETLNRRTGPVFGLIHDLLRDSLILGIGKLLDKGDRAYGLRHVIEELSIVPPDASDSLKAEIGERGMKLAADLGRARTLCAPVVQHRNRRVAHADREVLTGDEVLPGISRLTFRHAMSQLDELCDQIHRARHDSGLSYLGATMDMEPACSTLLKVLELGNTRWDEDRALGSVV